MPVTTLLDLIALVLFAVAGAWALWALSPAAGLAAAGLVLLLGAALADKLKGGE